jgi:hypothetical protein
MRTYKYALSYCNENVPHHRTSTASTLAAQCGSLHAHLPIVSRPVPRTSP